MFDLLLTQQALLTIVVFFATFFGTLTLGRLLKRRAGVRLGLLFQLFCLALAFYAAAVTFGLRGDWRGHFGAAVVLLSTAIVVALINRYVWDYYYEQRRQVIIPALLREFTAGIIFLIVLLLVLSIGYNAQAELRGLLAGSGVIAIILGFGMQNLLKTIVAGAEIQIQRPYKPGDWLKIGEHIGQVMEINLFDTRLRTNDGISIEVPNDKIVEETIINLTAPTPLHAMRLSVGVDYGTPPNRVKDALRLAASRADGIVPDQPPKAYLKEFGDSAIIYEVKFWMLNHAQYSDVCDAIRTNIWYEFKRRGINIPFPIRTLQVERKPKGAAPEEERDRARAILRDEPIFRCLSDEQVTGLLKQARHNQFGRGESLIVQGEEGDSMFILLRGKAQVSVNNNGSAVRVGVLRAGDCFGEMSLLTGEKRTATVRAEDDCEVLEIAKPVMAELLRQYPSCQQQLSELLAHRKMETEGILKEITRPEEQKARQREYTASFLKRLRSFLEL
jgi:small-conductance mechanosensitive channel/CRP-like cAMP-binding protein